MWMTNLCIAPNTTSHSNPSNKDFSRIMQIEWVCVCARMCHSCIGAHADNQERAPAYGTEPRPPATLWSYGRGKTAYRTRTENAKRRPTQIMANVYIWCVLINLYFVVLLRTERMCGMKPATGLSLCTMFVWMLIDRRTHLLSSVVTWRLDVLSFTSCVWVFSCIGYLLGLRPTRYRREFAENINNWYDAVNNHVYCSSMFGMDRFRQN